MPEKFHVILVKPTLYDEEGYPIQWFHSLIPANSLACMYGLTEDCANRRVLGENVDFCITAIDETTARVVPGKLIDKAGFQIVTKPLHDPEGD